MRSIVCREWGGPEKLALEDVPSPPLTREGVRIRVRAAGINFADLLLIRGQYQEKPVFPFTPGMEAAGIVTEIGTEVTDIKPGDRVLALTGLGGYAEEVVVDQTRVLRIPNGMKFESAAALPIAYGTSHGALEWRARLQSGEWLLVLGAAGGVGLAAVEIGKIMGARVIACAGTDEKLAIAREKGADYSINYSREDIRQRVKSFTSGDGADVVYDPVGGEAFDAALRSVAWGGRVLIIGFASGRIPTLPANIALVKNIDVIGFYWGSYQAHKPELVRQSFTQLLRWFEAGKLKPYVSHEFDLRRAGEAMEMLRQRKATGKVVLTVTSGPSE